MSRHPTLQRLCRLLLWQHPPWPQIKAHRLTLSPLQAPGSGFPLAAAYSFVWGADTYPIKKKSNGCGLGLWWPLFYDSHYNQPDSWRSGRGDARVETRGGGARGGMPSHRSNRQMDWQKNTKNNLHVGLRWLLIKNLYATTNQNQVETV